MNATDAFNCLRNEIQNRWPLWTPGPAETADWLAWLADFEYTAVALKAFMEGQTTL